jgi:hypothetical protein
MEKTNKKSNRSRIAVTLGRLGGQAIVRKRGKAYMRSIAKKGAKARWASKEAK